MSLFTHSWACKKKKKEKEEEEKRKEKPPGSPILSLINFLFLSYFPIK
jgi:hypothetical protein